jgi:hypothetical protein
MKEFEKLVVAEDFTLIKPMTKKAQLPGLGSQEEAAVQKVQELTAK